MYPHADRENHVGALTMCMRTERIIIVFVDAFRCVVKVTAPCIIGELCHNEVDRLNMLLTKQIKESPDAVLRAQLQRALDYVTRRPFSFTLLRAVRVDIKLPVTICALCVTNVLLWIEFMHFVL
ncbi:Gustatory receptor 30 [Operophtera brumata]|uniref:Gustatory receptor 30 n=1 Tax=Operophtera brumata TaxID=104452 RepID=A0A0L7LKI6_OPEBR|nr:Gustatory receptor 30 [Operophtera brumata]